MMYPKFLTDFEGKDLRIHNNTGLHHASARAKDKNMPLICAYVHCALESKWHGTSPWRVDSTMEHLRLM